MLLLGEVRKKSARPRYVILGVDPGDSALLAHETVHLFVEILDRYFNTVRELDIVYQFHKVYAILDEVILGGEVQETSPHEITARLDDRLV